MGMSVLQPLHKNWSFPLGISSVNVTKLAGNCGFGQIYWRNPLWKTSFFVEWTVGTTNHFWCYEVYFAWMWVDMTQLPIRTWLAHCTWIHGWIVLPISKEQVWFFWFTCRVLTKLINNPGLYSDTYQGLLDCEKSVDFL